MLSVRPVVRWHCRVDSLGSRYMCTATAVPAPRTKKGTEGRGARDGRPNARGSGEKGDLLNVVNLVFGRDADGQLHRLRLQVVSFDSPGGRLQRLV